jgi:hypothetical protein
MARKGASIKRNALWRAGMWFDLQDGLPTRETRVLELQGAQEVKTRFMYMFISPLASKQSE